MTEHRLMLSAMLALALGAGGCATSPARDTPPADYADDERYVVVTVRNGAAPPNPPAGSSRSRARYGPSYRVSPQAEQVVEAIGRDHGLALRSGWPIQMLGVHCVVFEVPKGRAMKKVLARLRADERVESAQRLNQFNTSATTLSAPDQDPQREWQYSLAAMNVAPLQARSLGEGVRIAVIDTGMDYRHPELAHAVAGRLDFVGHGSDRDSQEVHGTAVAGVIGALTGNGQGIAGIAPAAGIYALRACWSARSGAARGVCNSFTLARALGAAAEIRAHIVNLSLTGPADPLLERMLAVMLGEGTVVVMAAAVGSDGRLGARLPGVIRVHDAFEALPGDSAAIPVPGTDILSLRPGGQLGFHTGSSMAAAQLSGVAALILSMNRDLAPPALAQALRRASRASRSIGSAPSRRELPCLDACEAAAALGIAVRCAGAADTGRKSRVRRS